MKRLLIFTFTVFALNSAVSQTRNDIERPHLVKSDSSHVLRSRELKSSVNYSSFAENTNTNNSIIDDINDKGTKNKSCVSRSKTKQKKQSFFKRLKNHSFFPEQLALRVPHM